MGHFLQRPRRSQRESDTEKQSEEDHHKQMFRYFCHIIHVEKWLISLLKVQYITLRAFKRVQEKRGPFLPRQGRRIRVQHTIIVFGQLARQFITHLIATEFVIHALFANDKAPRCCWGPVHSLVLDKMFLLYERKQNVVWFALNVIDLLSHCL